MYVDISRKKFLSNVLKTPAANFGQVHIVGGETFWSSNKTLCFAHIYHLMTHKVLYTRFADNKNIFGVISTLFLDYITIT